MSGSGSLTPLTQDELREIRACLDAGAPLPEAYRFRLFAPSQEPVLLWPGKTLERCSEVHPLRLLEEHRPCGTSSAEPVLTDEAGQTTWRNLLIRGDNLLLLSSLLHGPLQCAIKAVGGIKLIYIDPPFAVGTDFTMPVTLAAPRSAPVSETCARRKAAGKRMKALAYRDSWEQGISSFLRMIHERLLLMRDLLAEDGSLYLHCDWRLAPCMRLVLDEIFGPERFLGDIVWHYTGGGRSERYFSRKHDRLLHYAASKRWIFNVDAVRVPYKPTSGYARTGITSAAGKHYAPNPLGTPVDDVWDIPMINPLAGERLDYPTQKPETLLERIVRASSRPGDLVADFFCGSGTLPAVAETLGRKWLAVDSSFLAVHTTRKRLLYRRDGLSSDALPSAFLLAEISPQPKIPATPGDNSDSSPGRGLIPASSGFDSHGGSGGIREKPKRLICFKEIFIHEARFPTHSPSYAITDLRMCAEVGNNEFSLELMEFSVYGRENRRVADPPLFISLLQQGWQVWLDYWSIGVPVQERESTEGMKPASSCNRILWHSARARKGEEPELRSPRLPLSSLQDTTDMPPGDTRTDDPQHQGPAFPPHAILVTIVDVFANESRVALTLSPQ